jgi:hypothetical protein
LFQFIFRIPSFNSCSDLLFVQSDHTSEH